MAEPVRFSHLKSMSRSPMHVRHAIDSDDSDQSLAMRIGSGTHAILFDQPRIVFTGKVRNGKKWDAFEQEHAGKCIMNVREYDQASRLVESIMRHQEAVRLLFASDAVRERRIHWKAIGRERCGTPDIRTARYVLELKTTKCAEPHKFNRDGVYRLYHAQLADYLEGVALSGLGTPSEAYIVAVESTPPHPVTVLRLTDNAIEQGRRLCRIWLEQLLQCERADAWPGYCDAIVDFDVDAPDEELIFHDDEEAA